MLYSVLENEEMCYVSIHAECALHTNSNDFLPEESLDEARKNQGFYCDRVNSFILQNIAIYKCEDKDLCLDFSRIDEFYEKGAPGFYTYLKESFYSKGRAVYFLNLKKDLYDPKEIMGDVQKIAEDTETISFCYSESSVVKSYEELISTQKKLFAEKFERLVVKSTDTCDDVPHRSVPVYLSKYVNLKKMVDTDVRMLRYAIYVLACKMVAQKIISEDYNLNRDVSLFFQTLNGGYVATQLAELFGVDMVFLDHLGPKKTVHRKSFEKYIKDNSKYIVVADVICLGGEIGRARTIIEYLGGRVLSEICLVDIRTVQSTSIENRISLYTVSNDCNKIQYMIKTDLCELCGKG